MNRTSFLKALALLPFVPKVAKAAVHPAEFTVSDSAIAPNRHYIPMSESWRTFQDGQLVAVTTYTSNVDGVVETVVTHNKICMDGVNITLPLYHD